MATFVNKDSTLNELRIELKKRGAKLSGRKIELFQRLEAYRRNDNFGQNDLINAVEYTVKTPEDELYRDINSNTEFVHISMDTVTSYLSLFDKHFDEKSKLLYDEQFLKYVRVCKVNDLYYVKSACCAEMKKTCSYVINICFDTTGSIVESECECAAGMGPNSHCKHVCTVLYACVVFSVHKFINTQETCTQKLQTFHHSKKFTGSPIKAENLNLPGCDQTSSDFDPRPLEFRNQISYPDFFRNVCLNQSFAPQMPIFQLYPPVNFLAVAHDHDYFYHSPEDIFLSHMNISLINSEIVENIERNTVGQSNNKRWFLERSKRIQSSNFGRICNATDRTNFKKLAESLIKPSADIRTAPILHGRKYEDAAIRKYEEISGKKVTRCGIFVSEKFPFIAASPDGFINDSTLIEVKCPYVAKDKLISSITVPYLHEDNGFFYLDKKHSYFFQVQGQMLCAKRKRCDFIVFTLKDVKIITIERDEEFILSMIKNLQVFYTKFFKEAFLNEFCPIHT